MEKHDKYKNVTFLALSAERVPDRCASRSEQIWFDQITHESEWKEWKKKERGTSASVELTLNQQKSILKTASFYF